MAIIKPVFKAITEIPIVKEVNGILGAVLGGLETFIFFMVLTMVLNGALVKNGKDVIENTL